MRKTALSFCLFCHFQSLLTKIHETQSLNLTFLGIVSPANPALVVTLPVFEYAVRTMKASSQENWYIVCIKSLELKAFLAHRLCSCITLCVSVCILCLKLLELSVCVKGYSVLGDISVGLVMSLIPGGQRRQRGPREGHTGWWRTEEKEEPGLQTHQEKSPLTFLLLPTFSPVLSSRSCVSQGGRENGASAERSETWCMSYCAVLKQDTQPVPASSMYITLEKSSSSDAWNINGGFSSRTQLGSLSARRDTSSPVEATGLICHLTDIYSK